MSDLKQWLREGRAFTPDWLEIKAVAAARIEELEAELANGSFYQEKDIDAMQNHIKELEAKLATARNDALEEAVREIDCGCREVCGGLDMCPKSDADAIRALKSTTQT